MSEREKRLMAWAFAAGLAFAAAIHAAIVKTPLFWPTALLLMTVSLRAVLVAKERS